MTLGNELIGAEVDPVARVAMSEGLSPGAASVLEVLRWLPVASADDLAAIMGRPATAVPTDLKKARGQSLVGSDQLGCTRGQRQRWFLSDSCLARSGLQGDTRHDEAARCRLLQLLPAVEQFCRVVGSVKNLGAFRKFQWLDATGDEGPSCDAAALYENGWISLFWCGTLLSETHLADRMVRFPLDCQTLAVGSPQPWPSQVHLVTADEWGREMAIRIVQDFGMERMAGVWCVADKTAAVPDHAGTGRGWIYQPVRRRQSGRSSWETSLAQSPWSGAGGLMAARVLDAVVQWPGARLPFLRALLQEGPGEGRVGQMCQQLAADGLVLKHGSGQSARYFATGRGINVRCSQDRIHHLDAWSRTGLSQWQEPHRTVVKHTVSPAHEDGLRGFLRNFAAEGCPVANGTRYGEHLGSDGGINPDAMLYLRFGPYGEGGITSSTSAAPGGDPECPGR